MTQAIIAAVVSALLTLYPGYVLGKRAQGRPRRYVLAFYGPIAVMVVVLAWALVAEDTLVAGAAIGCGFGLANGARHGYTQVFKKVRDAAEESAARD